MDEVLNCEHIHVTEKLCSLFLGVAGLVFESLAQWVMAIDDVTGDISLAGDTDVGLLTILAGHRCPPWEWWLCI